LDSKDDEGPTVNVPLDKAKQLIGEPHLLAGAEPETACPDESMPAVVSDEMLGHCFLNLELVDLPR
jgi:hypothetical protein